MSGSIKPNESLAVMLIFSPKEVIFYESYMTFTTQVTDRVLQISGQGVEYKLNENALPREVDLGKLDFCSPAEFTVIISF